MPSDTSGTAKGQVSRVVWPEVMTKRNVTSMDTGAVVGRGAVPVVGGVNVLVETAMY